MAGELEIPTVFTQLARVDGSAGELMIPTNDLESDDAILARVRQSLHGAADWWRVVDRIPNPNWRERR